MCYEKELKGARGGPINGRTLPEEGEPIRVGRNQKKARWVPSVSKRRRGGILELTEHGVDGERIPSLFRTGVTSEKTSRHRRDYRGRAVGQGLSGRMTDLAPSPSSMMRRNSKEQRSSSED